MADSTLGTTLRRTREAKGWSRATLAKKSTTSEPAIARTELYGSSPRLATLRQWAEALEVDISFLLSEQALGAAHNACPTCPQTTWHNGAPCPYEAAS